MNVKIKHMLLKKLIYSHANTPIINDVQNYLHDLTIVGRGILNDWSV